MNKLALISSVILVVSGNFDEPRYFLEDWFDPYPDYKKEASFCDTNLDCQKEAYQECENLPPDSFFTKDECIA